MTAKEDILKGIENGLDNSRKLTKETHYTQEHIRRVVIQLEREGLITILREPRGHTYKIKPPVYTERLVKEDDIYD